MLMGFVIGEAIVGTANAESCTSSLLRFGY